MGEPDDLDLGSTTASAMEAITKWTQAQSDHADQTALALVEARQIGQAVGIIMNKRQLSEPDAVDAFNTLVTQAGLPAADVAAAIVDGSLPIRRRSV